MLCARVTSQYLHEEELPYVNEHQKISMQYLLNILNDSTQVVNVLIYMNKYVLKICDEANTTKGTIPKGCSEYPTAV